MIIENKQAVNVNNGLYIDRVEEVTNQKDLQIILKCAKEWKTSAEKKITYYTKNKNTEKLPIAKDAKWVAISMIELLSKDGNNEPAYSLKTFKKNENAIFGAYDNKNFLQGAAFVNLSSCGDFDNMLDDILVNPERNGIIGKRELRTEFKGIGTKLIQAVVKKIMQKKGEQNLGTFSLLTAIPFYIKLGFEDICPGSGANSGPMTEIMCLEANKMKQLCMKV